MKKPLQKAIALLLGTTMMFQTVLLAGTAAAAENAETTETEKYTYDITSPYDDVDWSTWKQYKASLHSHTNASDAVPSIAESVKEHYDLGFQILAITDHAVIGVPWNEVPQMIPIYRLAKIDNTHMADPEVLTDEERDAIIGGTYESERRDAVAERMGQDDLGGMMEITGGCEANGATPFGDCHINTFWCDDMQAKMGVYGDYETVAKECDEAGGISFLDHTGEYPGNWFPRDDEQAKLPYYANKYANIFLDYDSCVAFDIDAERNDYVTWDEVLKLTIPKGRNVPCIAFSDMHSLENSDCDRSFIMMAMPEKTLEAFRTCMETGATFAIARRCSELGSDFDGTGKAEPEVYSIDVDNDEETITVNGGKYNYVKWISGGEVIAEGENLTSIDLNDYQDVLDCYVRFELIGEGGILYSQPFVTMANEKEYSSDVYAVIDMPRFFRIIINFLNITFGWTPPVALVRALLWNRIWWF